MAWRAVRRSPAGLLLVAGLRSRAPRGVGARIVLGLPEHYAVLPRAPSR